MSEQTNDILDTIKEPVAKVAEEISDQADQFADFARRLNRTKVIYAVGGWALGAATGAFVAYKIAYARAETKYSEIADAEIAEMHNHYQQKGKALESEAAKGDLETIVVERGYVQPRDEKPPMVVKPPTPPTSMMNQREQREPREEKVVEDAPDEEPEVKNVFREAEITHEWDWHGERRRRSPDTPYVIHVDEKYEMEGYDDVTLTYYAGDDILCNDRDEIIDHDERHMLIGDGNLDRFGHGSGDPVIVYIRNDKLEICYEVVRSPNEYAEEVHGIHHSGYGKNLERMRVRERNDQEE